MATPYEKGLMTFHGFNTVQELTDFLNSPTDPTSKACALPDYAEQDRIEREADLQEAVYKLGTSASKLSGPSS